MNILVIGNGFDLAHELPTKYTDFLAFCKMIINVYTIDERDCDDFEEIEQKWNELKLQVSNNSKGLNELFHELYSNRVKIEHNDEIIDICTNSPYDKFFKAISNNFWIKYFLDKSMYQKENWIDFESEIRKIITSIDEDMQNTKINVGIIKLTNEFVKKFFLVNSETKKKTIIFNEFGGCNDNIQNKAKSYSEIIARLKLDLEKLCLALKIYLVEYVEKINIAVESIDIKELALDGILSFNYTHTYKKRYAGNNNIDYDFIHGEADQDSKNSIVIGINEYLPDNRKDRDIEFIAFKKYYQRIYNETGCKYKEWENRIILESRSELFIFGHSLDITDGDILKELILNNNVHTTIFYHNKEAMGQQIANLVKIIGQEELIRRTGGSTKTIIFKRQQDMVKAI